MIKIKINHILSAFAAVLFALCVASVYSPVHFAGARQKREAAVKERLTAIRKAEEQFRRKNGVYAGSFAQLASQGFLADSMKYIPYGGGEAFELSATVIRGATGSMTPLMECGATYGAYLKGLDENRIKEITEEADQRGEYPGLKIGDTTTPNDNAGNWE